MSLKPFEPGHNMGRPKSPAELKAARKLTRTEFESIASKYMSMSKKDIEAASRDENLTMLESMIVSIIHKAISHGDQRRLDFLLDRLIGKVVQPIEVLPPPPPPPTTRVQIDVSSMSDEQVRMLFGAVERDVTPSAE